jgi:uncharacterized protein (TIGR02147 family)
MDVYEFSDYKKFVLTNIKLRPNRGRGQLAKIASDIGVNSSLMSQVFNGPRHLTEEQAYSVAEFFGLNSRESFFFLLLVQKERAGSVKLKKLLTEQIQNIQKDSLKLKSRIVPEKQLTPEQQAVYYSNWLFTAIHTLSSIEEYQTLFALGERLNISIVAIKKAADLLLEYGLCIEQQGKILVGPKSTYIPSDSPLVLRHHSNWRIKALEQMPGDSESNFFFTAPISLSESDFAAIRYELVKFIEQLAKQVESSKSETAACLNLDFFKF